MLKVTNSNVGSGPKFVLGSKFANTCTKGQQKGLVVLWYQPLFLTWRCAVAIVSFAMASTTAVPKSVHSNFSVTKNVSCVRDDAADVALSTLNQYFVALFAAHGPQHWWPSRSRFEVIVGAILTQNTSWRNVEAAIANLQKARRLTPSAMRATSLAKLASLVKPSGYYRQKAKKLKALVDFLFGAHGGSLSRMFRTPTTVLREQLLAVHGIGPETADAILQSSSPDIAELKDIVKDILQDDRRASEVIRRMRSLLTKAPFELKSLDLNDVAREAVEFLSSLAVARKVELISLITQNALPILGDRIQLQQVILNLVVNGIDSMRDMPSENRIIGIRTSRVDNFAQLSVLDRGPGIPEGKLKEIFEPFFTSKPEGMGMGLSIAHTIIEAHHGLIWAKNRDHGGASLRIRLPLVQELVIHGMTHTKYAPTSGAPLRHAEGH
jgi:signal transduction histidine kinase